MKGPSKRRKYSLWAIRGILAVGLVYTLFALFGSPLTVSTLASLNLAWLLIAALAYAMALLFASWRIRCVVNLKGRLSFKDAFWANVYGMLMAEVTPGKAGYVLAVEPLKRSGVEESVGFSSILVSQAADFLVRGALAIVATWYLVLYLRGTSFQEGLALWAVAIVIIVAVVALLFFAARTPLLVQFLRRLKLLPVGTLDVAVTTFQDNVSKSRGLWKELCALTLLSWVFTSARWIALGQGLGLSLDLTALLLLQPLVGLLAFVPFSIGGLGFLEGGTTAVLILLGVAAPVAIAFALLDRLLTISTEALGFTGGTFLRIHPRRNAA